MKTYTVTVTGTWNVEVEAESQDHAIEEAKISMDDSRMGIWDMNLEFEAYDEEDV